MIQGISMFRKPTLKQNVALSYQNFPPLAKQTISYSAATTGLVAPKCTMNFRAAASKEEPVQPPPVARLPAGWIQLVPDSNKEDLDAFDYNQGMLRAARTIFQRYLEYYFAEHGLSPAPMEWMGRTFWL